jgi:hypothetical protein
MAISSLRSALSEPPSSLRSALSEPPSETRRPCQDRKHGYQYLLRMPLWNMTIDKIKSLQLEYDKQEQELRRIEAKSIREFWKEDLAQFLTAYEVFLKSSSPSTDAMDLGKPDQQEGHKRKLKGHKRRRSTSSSSSSHEHETKPKKSRHVTD